MAIHVQRKRFDHPKLALAAANGFRDFVWDIPGVEVAAESREIDGVWWVYVTQVGNLVVGDEPTLPEYERVV